MVENGERVVDSAVKQGKLSCFHEDCAERLNFFKEDGIAHHFKFKHPRINLNLNQLLQKANQFTARQHDDETISYLRSWFEKHFQEVNFVIFFYL